MGDPRIDEALASGHLPLRVTRADLEKSQDLTGIVSISVVTGLATLVVICRLLSRKFIIKRFGFGLDDGMTLASLVVFIPFSALCIKLIDLGTGRSVDFGEFVVDRDTWIKQQVYDSIAHLVYATALVLCRISGLAFYYRICALHKEFLIAIRIIFAVLVAGYLTQMFLIIFHCKPVTMLWAPTSPEEEHMYECLWWEEIYGSMSGISLACDLLLFGLPVAMLRILEMPRKQKVQLACILLPGIAVIVISISRIFLVIGFAFQSPETFDFAFLRLLIVEVAEIGATLIALSIPGVKPMVDNFILRKDMSELGSRTCSNRGSIGSQSSSRGVLKGRAPFGVFDDDSTAQYGAAVFRGDLNEDVKPEGIQVTVDVYVEGAKNGSKERYQDFT